MISKRISFKIPGRPESFAGSGEASPLVVGESQPGLAELIEANAILLDEVLDRPCLLGLGQSGEEQQQQLQSTGSGGQLWQSCPIDVFAPAAGEARRRTAPEPTSA